MLETRVLAVLRFGLGPVVCEELVVDAGERQAGARLREHLAELAPETTDDLPLA